MKTFLPAVLFLFFACRSLAQPKLSITYRTQYFTYTGQKDPAGNRTYIWMSSVSLPTYKLSVNEGASYFRNTTPEISQHGVCNCDPSVFYNDGSFVYHSVEPLTEKELMVREALPADKWYFTRETDTICGFACRKAIRVSGQDYVYAWYAWDLPAGFGPFNYTGLPGTVLRVEMPGVSYVAVSVNDDAEEIKIPATAKIDADQYAVLSREKRKYRAGLFGKRVDPYEVPRPRIMRY